MDLVNLHAERASQASSAAAAIPKQRNCFGEALLLLL
jgi:hypothetical protein